MCIIEKYIYIYIYVYMYKYPSKVFRKGNPLIGISSDRLVAGRGHGRGHLSKQAPTLRGIQKYKHKT